MIKHLPNIIVTIALLTLFAHMHSRSKEQIAKARGEGLQSGYTSGFAEGYRFYSNGCYLFHTSRTNR